MGFMRSPPETLVGASQCLNKGGRDALELAAETARSRLRLSGVAQTFCLLYRRLAVCQFHAMRGPGSQHPDERSSESILSCSSPSDTTDPEDSRTPSKFCAPCHSQPGRLQVCDTADNMSALLLRPSRPARPKIEMLPKLACWPMKH